MSFRQLTQRALRILTRRGAYRACFHGDTQVPTAEGRAVLKDLAKFCRAYESTVMVGPEGYDSHATAVAQGRREVWLRIQSMLDLPDTSLLSETENPDE